MSDKSIFKSCPSCHESWESREKFLADASLKLVGYQVHFKNLEEGLFLFNHISCKSTISIPSGRFSSLYNGPIFTKNMVGKDGCPDHCLSKTNLQSCPAECECNYVREIIQIIKAWDKKNNKDTESLDIKSENYYDE
jgi:hypothetical protein